MWCSALSAGATRIPHCSNVRFRNAFNLPAVSSLCFNPQQMAFYARLRARQSTGKPGVIGVRRKLLLCYSLWENDCVYDPQYYQAHYLKKEVPRPVDRPRLRRMNPKALFEGF